jgi:hypothetical protein
METMNSELILLDGATGTELNRHVRNWYCHYQGSARVYCMVGYSLVEAMEPLLTTKP